MILCWCAILLIHPSTLMYTKFSFQPVYVPFVFFLLHRLQGDHASPLPLALNLSTHLLSLLRSFCFLITLSLSLLCLCVYCVGVLKWAGVSPLASDWLAKTYEDWLHTVYSAGESRGGGENSSRLGSGESGDRVRGCFCFEMAGFESRRRTSQLLCQWHTELIGPDSCVVSLLAKAAAILLFFLFHRVQL